jgi:hypothetical protein
MVKYGRETKTLYDTWEQIVKMQDIPEGKVKTKDGQIIDRADACFLLNEHPKDNSLLRAIDGTVYQKRGCTLHRLTFKKREGMTKADRKRLRREHFKGQHNVKD